MKKIVFPSTTFIVVTYCLILLSMSFSSSLFAQATGKISGILKDDDKGEAVPFLSVRVKDTPHGAASDEQGRYVIPNIPAGTYTIVVSGVGLETVERKVEVHAGSTTVQDFALKHSSVRLDEILVYGASLRRERITEAPSAISLLEARDITRNAGSGQLPSLLQNEAGIDIAQNGLSDFNVNTRGFNSSLNRRLLVLLDGRDLGTAFLGATEWNGLSIPLEELGRIEIVRGPGSALYGANAYNGVVNITSTPPRSSKGTRIIIGGGELSSYRGDIRHSDVFDQWSYRINVGGYSGKTLSRSRVNLNFEYEGFNPYLNSEVIDLNPNPVQSLYGSARIDYDYRDGGVATIEGGLTQVENEVIVTGIGRVQAVKAHRPWGRIGYSGHGFNVVLWTAGRYNKEPDRSLSTGLPLTQDALISQGEVQYNFSLLDNRLFVVTGLSHRLVNIDTKGTLMLSPRNDNMSGIFGQVEYKLTDNLKTVFAARWDRSTLHESKFSPKVAVVWSPIAGHTFRASYNSAFQAPNYSELFLHVKHPTRPLAYYGNKVENPPGLVGFIGGAQPGVEKDIVVERIDGVDIGFKGVFGNSLFVTIDGYYNSLKDFVTDLAVGVNPRFPASGGVYVDETGVPTRTIWSYVNAGKVTEAGVEVAANYYLSDQLLVDGNVTLFSFTVQEKDQNDILIPNSPKYRLSGGITYTHPAGHDINVKVKYVPTFPWAAGIYRGDILAYTLVNLAGTYKITPAIAVNGNISNVLNRKHYEIFGGSFLSRRAVLTLIVSF